MARMQHHYSSELKQRLVESLLALQLFGSRSRFDRGSWLRVDAPRPSTFMIKMESRRVIQRQWTCPSILKVVAVLTALTSCSPDQSTLQDWPDWESGSTPDLKLLVKPDRNTCEGCMVWSEQVRLRDTIGEGIIDETGTVARDQSSRIWGGFGNVIKVYGPGGAFIQSVGRKGQGPAEFEAIGSIFSDGLGNMHVVDQLAFRETIFTPGFELVEIRQLALGPIFRAVSLDEAGQRVFVNAQFMDPERVGHPIHILEKGVPVLSFGRPNDTAFMATSSHMMRAIAVSKKGYLAAANRFEYKVEVFTQTGERLLRFERPNAWPYPPNGQGKALEEQDELWGFVQDLRFDDQDRLWVLSWEPRSDWRERVETVEGPNGMKMLRQRASGKGLRTSRVEVFDLKTGRLIASQTHELMVWGFLSEREAYAFAYSEGDEPELVVLSFSLKDNVSR